MFNVNQITSELAKMADPMLQKYAAMHKDDPYTVALAVGESNRRKSLRTAAQAKMAGAQQPKVVDQDIASMAAVDPMGNVTGALPEDIGIGRLAAPNLKRMADGGIVGFAAKGAVESDPKQAFATEYRPIAESVGERLGIDPGILISQWGHESAWGKKTVGKYNFGNIKDVTGKGPRAHDKIEGSRSAYKSYESPEQFAEDYTKLIEKNFPKAINTGKNVNAFSEGLKEGVNGPYATDKKYAEKLTNTYTNLFPSAQATSEPEAPPAAPATGNVPTSQRTGAIIPASQLAGAGIGALDKIRGLYNTYGPTTRTGSMFRNLRPATQLGIAAEGAAATALPISAVGMGGATLAQGAANALSNATPEQLEMLQNDVGSDTGLAAAIMNPANRGPQPNQMPYGQQMTELGKRIVSYPTGEKPKEEETAPASTDRLSPQVPDELKRIESAQRGAAEDVQVKPPAPAPAAPATGEKTTSGGLTSLFKDPAFLMGMRLMASKDPRFLGAAGEAGIGTVGDLAAAEKASSESEYRKSMGKYYGAYADAIERGAKEKNEVQSAEKAAQEALDNWSKNNKMALLQSPGLYDQMRDKYRMDAYSAFGIKMPQAVTQQGAPRNDPLGILGKG